MNKKTLLIVLGFVLTVLMLIALTIILVEKKNEVEETSITNFAECEKAGFPIMESYPRQCRADSGDTFVEDLSNDIDDDTPGLCLDNCGDGVCQEIVCLGTGCPCAETKESCPSDCNQ